MQRKPFMKKKIKIFYSWQSDLLNKTNRSFIEEALEKAVKKLKADKEIEVEPVIDRDTQGVQGSPDINEIIFQKISEADVFVCDVSFINSKSNETRLCPNPNVLLELGYALKCRGWERILLVFNLAYGRIEDLPFDINRRRATTYKAEVQTNSLTDSKKELAGKLARGLKGIITKSKDSKEPFELSIKYEAVKINKDSHQYKMLFCVKNTSDKVFKEYRLLAMIPKKVLRQSNSSSHAFEINEKATKTHRCFSITNKERNNQKIYPNDEKDMLSISYRMDNDIFHDTVTLEQKAAMEFFLDDYGSKRKEVPIKQLQNF